MTATSKTDREFNIKMGARSPRLEVRCKDGNNDADLSNATTVTFSMRKRDGSSDKVNNVGAAFVNKTTSPNVYYEWGATDTDTEGQYFGNFKVTWGDGTYTIFPDDGYIYITVQERIGS